MIPDASTAAAALQAGEVDMWEQPALDLLPVLERNRNIKLQKLTEMSNVALLRPNSLHPPFNNPKARQALAYIIDQRDVMAAGFGDEKDWKTPSMSAAAPTAAPPAPKASARTSRRPASC